MSVFKTAATAELGLNLCDILGLKLHVPEQNPDLEQKSGLKMFSIRSCQ